MSYLSLERVFFRYTNDSHVVEDLSMSFEKGESVAIIGQNGAGKTTTAKLINGLLKPTEGSVTISGKDTKNSTAAQISKKVGYVFQNPDDQIFHSKVYDEIRFGPKNLGFNTEKIENNIKKSAELVGISSFLDYNPYDLPYSTRKFVTVASIVAMDQDIIILDEPTAGQDHIGMRHLSNLISTLKEERKTVITITHDMKFVVDNFERVIVMANKRLLADGEKREIFWNSEVLDKASLKQPHISRLSSTLGLQEKILTIPELVTYLKEKNVDKNR